MQRQGEEDNVGEIIIFWDCRVRLLLGSLFLGIVHPEIPLWIYTWFTMCSGRPLRGFRKCFHSLVTRNLLWIAIINHSCNVRHPHHPQVIIVHQKPPPECLADKIDSLMMCFWVVSRILIITRGCWVESRFTLGSPSPIRSSSFFASDEFHMGHVRSRAVRICIEQATTWMDLLISSQFKQICCVLLSLEVEIIIETRGEEKRR